MYNDEKKFTQLKDDLLQRLTGYMRHGAFVDISEYDVIS